MADVVTIKVEGLAELEKRMQTLSLDMQNKIARAATAAAAVVVGRLVSGPVVVKEDQVLALVPYDVRYTLKVMRRFRDQKGARLV